MEKVLLLLLIHTRRQKFLALCCGFAGTGKAPHAADAANKVAGRSAGVCEGHPGPVWIKIQMAFPSKAPDTPPSFEPNSKRFCSTEWFFPPPPGRERLQTATNVNGRASGVRSFPSAIKQQQGEAAAFRGTAVWS